MAGNGVAREPSEVLLVEDDPGDAALIELGLQRAAPHEFSVTRATSWSDAEQHLEHGRFDAIITDLGLPDRQGLEVVREAVRAAPGLPVIISTGNTDETQDRDALRLGAQEYVVKDETGDRALARIVRHAIERRRILDQLEESRNAQVRIKDEFLSQVSHELRTPLTAIHQFVTILTDGIAGELSSEQTEYLGIIHRNVIQLRDMIGDLTEVARVESGKMRIELRRVDLTNLADEVAGSFVATAGHKDVELTAPGDDPHWVMGDAVRLRQVLGNLVTNAIKFTRPGGKIRVEVVRSLDDPEQIMATVADTGCGIEPEHCEQIFRRLHQVEHNSAESRRGLGLGLYICKEVVERHGGRIWVDSTLGEGSQFRFTIPRFSIERLIDPVCSSELTRSLCLVSVRVVWDQQRGRPSDGELDEIHELLGASVLRGLDVVLPRTGWSGDGESFFVVASTDAAGADAMFTRLERQLASARIAALRGGRLEKSVTELASSVEELQSRGEIATRIAALMNLS